MRQESFDDRPKQPAATRDEATQGATIFHSEAAFDLVRRHLACDRPQLATTAAARLLSRSEHPGVVPAAAKPAGDARGMPRPMR